MAYSNLIGGRRSDNTVATDYCVTGGWREGLQSLVGGWLDGWVCPDGLKGTLWGPLSGPILAGMEKRCVVQPLTHVKNSGVKILCTMSIRPAGLRIHQLYRSDVIYKCLFQKQLNLGDDIQCFSAHEKGLY